SVVFGTLFRGQKLPKPKEVVDLAGPQLSVGVAFASGQYVVGIALVTFLLAPLFGINEAAGALIEIGFEGGHGTAAGMQSVFEDIEWAEGYDLAVAVATVGLLSGIVIGVAVINWAIRTGRTEVITEVKDRALEQHRGRLRRDEHYIAAEMAPRPSAVGPLSLPVAVLGVAIGVGVILLQGLQWIEEMLWIDEIELLSYVPVFPMALLGG